MDEDTRFWDTYSHTYDAVRFAIPYRELLDTLVDALELEPGTSVLDLGCATGNLEERIGQRVPEARVTGLDHSEGMLRQASRRCRAFPHVRFVRADLTEPLPFADGSFDRVVLNNVLYALPDHAAVIAEARRVLRPGGLFVLSDPKPGSSIGNLVRAHFGIIAAMPPARRILAYAKTCFTLPVMGLAPILMITTSVGRKRRTGEYRFSTHDELDGLLAGFDDARVGSAYAGENWLAVGHVSETPVRRTASSARSSASSLPVNDITSP